MAEELNRSDDRSRKKRCSDISPQISPDSSLTMCDRLAQSYPSPRCRSAADSNGASNRLYSGFTKQVFGSPSYPSPLDRIRTGRRDRAKQLGLHSLDHNSFEANQSFPKINPSRAKQEVDCSVEIKKTLQDFKGQGLNDVSFAPGLARGSFTPSSHSLVDTSPSLGESWSYFNYIGGGSSGMSFPTTVRNPNKAVVTIDAKSSEILVANEMASELFGFSQEELLGLELNDLVTLKSKSQETIAESHLEDSGEIIEVSGKVMDAVDSTGLIIPISLWIRRLDTGTPRCLVVMEPLERTTAKLNFDSTGKILACDYPLAMLYGYPDAVDMTGLKMSQIIPSFKLPEPEHTMSQDIKKQRATGRTRDGATFPLSIYIQKVEDSILSGTEDKDDSLDESGVDVYFGVVWVFTNISGMITVLPDGKIHSVNNNFSLMLFGYTQSELIGKDICEIIPSFRDEVEVIDTRDMPLPPVDDEPLKPTNKPKRSLLKSNLNDDDVFLDMSQPNSANTSLDVSLSQYMEQGIHQSGDSTSRSETETGQQTEGALTSKDKGCIQSNNSKTKAKIPSLNLDSSPERERHQVASSSSRSTTTPPTSRFRLLADEKLNMSRDIGGIGDGLEYVRDSDEESPRNDKDLLEDNEDLSNVSGATDDLLEASDILIKEVLQADDQSRDVEELTNIMTSLRTDKSNTSSDVCNNVRNVNLDALGSTAEIFQDVKRVHAQLKQSLSDCLVEYDCDVECNKENEADSSYATDSGVLSVSGPQKPPRCIKRQSHVINNTESSPKIHNNNFLSPVHIKSQDESGDNNMSKLTNGLSISMKTSTPMSLPRPGPKQEALSKLLARRRSSLSYKEADDYTGDGARNSGNDVGSLSGSRGSSRNSWLSHRPVSNQSSAITEGSYVSQCRHKDRSDLGIIYQIKRVQLANGQSVYCIWISRDPEDPGEGGRSFANLTLASSLSSTMGGQSMDASQFPDASAISLGEQLLQKAKENRESEQLENKEASMSKQEDARSCDWSQPLEEDSRTGSSCQDYIPGGSIEYDNKYNTLNSIGKGAFGFVKIGERKSDNEQVVVKFIKKSKLSAESLVEKSIYGKVPQEVAMLAKLHHPNVVRVLDCLEGQDFYHLIMKKHGSGMDLFEFIDRCPNLDEPLSSYIFRQLVSAVSYLHDEGVIHRDVKDENIILNEVFALKLIDFGSAAYLKSGQLFGTFCGTLEYCGPEVLQGNKYAGPEMEVWSMGITLYTLVFGENPFYDVDETIKGVISPPFEVSKDLMEVIGWLLHPNPELRATVKDIERDPWVIQPIDISSYTWEQVLPNCDFSGNTASDHRDEGKEELRREVCIEDNDLYLHDIDLDESFNLDSINIQHSEPDSENSALEKEYRRFLGDEMSTVDDCYSDHSSQTS